VKSPVIVQFGSSVSHFQPRRWVDFSEYEIRLASKASGHKLRNRWCASMIQE
jgi:hypothetical protein